MGIHWGTYDMGSTEPYNEPPQLFEKAGEKAMAIAKAIGKDIGEVFTVRHGETWTFPTPNKQPV